MHAVTEGLVGWYTPASYAADSRMWKDLSGNGNHGTVTGTVYMVSGTAGNLGGQPYLHGDTSGVITFPKGAMPSVHTLFHVAKYDGPTRGRILAMDRRLWWSNVNWLSGFHAGCSGVAHHFPGPAWITDVVNRHGTNWVLSADQQYMYRSQGVNRTNVARGVLADYQPPELTINGFPNTPSDWAMATLLIYRGELSNAQVVAVEDALSSTYDLAMDRPRPPGGWVARCVVVW